MQCIFYAMEECLFMFTINSQLFTYMNPKYLFSVCVTSVPYSAYTCTIQKHSNTMHNLYVVLHMRILGATNWESLWNSSDSKWSSANIDTWDNTVCITFCASIVGVNKCIWLNNSHYRLTICRFYCLVCVTCFEHILFMVWMSIIVNCDFLDQMVNSVRCRY